MSFDIEYCPINLNFAPLVIEDSHSLFLPLFLSIYTHIVCMLHMLHMLLTASASIEDFEIFWAAHDNPTYSNLEMFAIHSISPGHENMTVKSEAESKTQSPWGIKTKDVHGIILQIFIPALRTKSSLVTIPSLNHLSSVQPTSYRSYAGNAIDFAWKSFLACCKTSLKLQSLAGHAGRVTPGVSPVRM